MNTRPLLAAFLITASAALAACSDDPAEPLVVAPAPPATAEPSTAGGTDASVPPAASVVEPAGQVPTDPAAGRADQNTMTDAQESASMPLPGQNNDHSLPQTGPASAAATR